MFNLLVLKRLHKHSNVPKDPIKAGFEAIDCVKLFVSLTKAVKYLVLVI